jgi:hypothetical protein
MSARGSNHWGAEKDVCGQELSASPGSLYSST